MEDSKKMKAQPKNATQDNGWVINLTPDMETAAGARAKIIELTQVFKTPSDKPESPTETVPAPLAETTAAPEAHQPPDEVDTPNIEADVDAAFDAMRRSVPHQPSDDTDDTEVALRTIAEPDPLTPASTTEPELELTMDELAADEPWDGSKKGPQPAPDETAEAGAMAPDKTLELTDIVHPIDLKNEAAGFTSAEKETIAEAGASDAAPGGQEEPIDLTDAVEPSDAQNHSDASGISTMDENDVLELTDIVDPDQAADVPEEEVVELTDIVLAEEAEAAAAPDMDDTIELIDIVAPDETAGIQEDEEEIIELSDIVLSDDAEPEQNEVIELTDIVDTNERADLQEEEIIELADVVRPDDTDAARDAGAPPTVAAENSSAQPDLSGKKQPPATDQESEEQVIRLDSVLNHLRENRSAIERDVALGVEEELFNTPPMDGREKQFDARSPADPEVEKTIEKILTTKYAHTIETLIAKMVEKVVTREIESIKRNLMEGED